jgi:hypothetical protein
MCATSSAGRSDHNLYPYTINELLPRLLSANCGEPSPPSDGYIEPYTSTVEGAVVNRVHVCENGQQSWAQAEQISCSPYGQWESINGSTCYVMPGIIVNFISAID